MPRVDLRPGTGPVDGRAQEAHRPHVVLRPTLHVPSGLPGAGKTTLARELAEQGVVHVALDDHRRRLWPDCPPSWNPYTGRGLVVHAAWEAEVLGHLAAGRDVCADRTFLDPRALARLRVLAPLARVVRHDLTGIPVETCVARDAARPVATRVGEAGIRALWGRWLAPGAERARDGPHDASPAIRPPSAPDQKCEPRKDPFSWTP